MAIPRPEKRLRKKKKPPQKFRLSYSLMLLFAMVVVGAIAGIVAFSFGKQALEGVNPSPAGIKLPKVSPPAKPKESPKPSPQAQPNNKTSFFLDESEIIAEVKARSQEEIGSLTRPNFVAKVNKTNDRKTNNTNDRKTVISTRVDRAYDSMRDPLAISANADERIAERIIELRQRVYTSNRPYERKYERNFERPIANNASNSLPLLSTPVEITPIRSRWEDRDAALVNSNKVNVEIIEIESKPTSSVFIPDKQPSQIVEINRR